MADGWIVAYALAKGCTVVTHEAYAPDAKNRVKIPNVCMAFHVSYTKMLEMLRSFGALWGNV